MMENFQTKLVSQSDKSLPVYLITGTAQGKPAWHYVQVDAIKHQVFKKQLEKRSVDVAQFGKVLRSGWGVFPADPIIALMQEKYAA